MRRRQAAGCEHRCRIRLLWLRVATRRAFPQAPIFSVDPHLLVFAYWLSFLSATAAILLRQPRVVLLSAVLRSSAETRMLSPT